MLTTILSFSGYDLHPISFSANFPSVEKRQQHLAQVTQLCCWVEKQLLGFNNSALQRQTTIAMMAKTPQWLGTGCADAYAHLSRLGLLATELGKNSFTNKNTSWPL